jgi:hypothetical protein
MNPADKKIILLLVTRTGMMVPVTDENSILSFIFGYEAGRNGKCEFTKILKEYLDKKYKVQYSSDGWSGQISRYCKSKHLNWVNTFKKVSLEVLAESENQKFSTPLRELYRTRVISLIDRIKKEGDPFFRPDWVHEVVLLCSHKTNWFKNLWSDDELRILKQISIELSKHYSTIFENWQPLGQYVPSKKLLSLKADFDKKLL